MGLLEEHEGGGPVLLGLDGVGLSQLDNAELVGRVARGGDRVGLADALVEEGGIVGPRGWLDRLEKRAYTGVVRGVEHDVVVSGPEVVGVREELAMYSRGGERLQKFLIGLGHRGENIAVIDFRARLLALGAFVVGQGDDLEGSKHGRGRIAGDTGPNFDEEKGMSVVRKREVLVTKEVLAKTHRGFEEVAGLDFARGDIAREVGVELVDVEGSGERVGGRSDEHSEGGASDQSLSNTKGLEQTKRGPPPGKEENALVLVGVGAVFANLVVEALGVRILAPLGHLPIFLRENLLHLGPVERVALCQPTKIAKGEGGDDPVLGEADDDVGIEVGMLGQVRE